mmetsp:Transcript_53698/g.85442  ORF Transcript_53698/g.85442 Transcript_53698/m.85442 type:complete len:479 (-) Transcript_53698:153-1589(-)
MDARTVPANGQAHESAKQHRGCSSCGDGCLKPIFATFLGGQDEAENTATTVAGDDEGLDFQVRRSLSTHKGGRRPSVTMMQLHRKTVESSSSSAPKASKNSSNSGDPITRSNITKGMYVTRGPDWKHGNEDGGRDTHPGIGEVWHLEMSSDLATVMWGNGRAYGHYRFGSASDLAEHKGPKESNWTASSSLGSYGASSSLQLVSATCRRNSQAMFSQKNQTAIVLDWDDTLFPSTHLRFTLRLSPRLPLSQQRISPQHRTRAEAVLNECAAHSLELLRAASQVGNMVIVTLARKPWVTDSCAYFYPGVGDFLREHNVKIVYAQESLTESPNVLTKGMSDEELADFWAGVKGSAIARELEEMHTLYAGQSWKNVISIGDSEFERLGTRVAINNYSAGKGLDSGSTQTAEVNGHLYKIRTKTFKMLDGPSAEELMVQVQMLQRWVPYLVALDDSFDADLNDVNDMEAIRKIEDELKIPQE